MLNRGFLCLPAQAGAEFTFDAAEVAQACTRVVDGGVDLARGQPGEFGKARDRMKVVLT